MIRQQILTEEIKTEDGKVEVGVSLIEDELTVILDLNTCEISIEDFTILARTVKNLAHQVLMEGEILKASSGLVTAIKRATSLSPKEEADKATAKIRIKDAIDLAQAIEKADDAACELELCLGNAVV